jgi:Protein of unknown function (DUF2795)
VKPIAGLFQSASGKKHAMRRAVIESLLVGVALPAERRELLEYARAQPRGEQAAARLAQIPDRRYRSLNEVGEELEPVEPVREERRVPPRPESGDPPGGPGYVGEPAPRPNE